MRAMIRAIAAFSTLLALATPAAAMFRCGNTFQDKPCESGSQQVITPGRTGTAPAAAGAPVPQARPGGLPTATHVSGDAAAVCARVGERVEGVIRKRDAGATAQQQMQGADPETVRAVQMVYAMGKGGKVTVAQMRAFAEMGCIGDEQVKSRTQAAMRAAREAEQQGLTPQQRRAAVEKAAGLHDPCGSLREALASIDHLAKAGGDAAYMARLREQRALTEQQRNRLGCR